MSELGENLWKFAKQRLEALDLLPDYLGAVIAHWNDIFFSSIPMLPFVAWWYLGEPPMAIKAIVFMWVFVVAGYYAWRKEHLKTLSDGFNCFMYVAVGDVDPTAAMLGDRSIKVFVGVRIVNVGPPTSIHTWQVSYTKPGESGRVHLSDHYLLRGEVEQLPGLIRGHNLHGDYRMFATGETREGWVAFNGNDDPKLLESISLLFTDAFNKTHPVSWLSGWKRE